MNHTKKVKRIVLGEGYIRWMSDKRNDENPTWVSLRGASEEFVKLDVWNKDIWGERVKLVAEVL